MLTKLTITNFKRFGPKVEIDLGKVVVFIGPNNSGKTSALQSIALWDIAVKKWLSKRGGKSIPTKRPGVTINRNDLTFLPVPSARQLWNDLHVRNIDKSSGKTNTTNILFTVGIEGVDDGQTWDWTMQFDYANEESFYCKPVSPFQGDSNTKKIAYLPPMSGLAAVEPKWEPGRINVLLGEGQTAQVLRNLCHQIYSSSELKEKWPDLVRSIRNLFGIELLPPQHLSERGEIVMAYKERESTFDITSSGRGLQQTVLLLSHLYLNPNAILLLDEPDAHLEILRQRQIFSLLSDVAELQHSQVIIASHSEVILNEAAGRHSVIAFVGNPHILNERGSHLLKALNDIGWEDYYLAELNGWVLYLEDSTDLAILKEFARVLRHDCSEILERAFVKYVSTNLPQKARSHFYGLREAMPNLRGAAIFDRLDKKLEEQTPLIEVMWKRREIENYLCLPETLLNYAISDLEDNLFGRAEKDRRQSAMKESIDEVSSALKTLGKGDAWSYDLKVSDEFLDPLFANFFSKLELPLLLRKGKYALLAKFVPLEKLDSEIKEKLDLILKVARS